MRWTGTEAAVLNRRSFLSGLAAAGLLPLLPHRTAAALGAGDPDEPLFASARRNADGRHAVAILTADGRDVLDVPLPDRGHGIALSPDRSRFVTFARRPGQFLMLVDREERQAPQVTSAEPGRHYYGHGVFSGDGRLVYAVENAFGPVGEETRGRVGVYDASGERLIRIGEFDTHGVGPHDILLAEKGRVLVVANGGIDTHPVTGRDMLNLDRMQPSIARIDAASGDLLGLFRLPPDLSQVSLRHMALDVAGSVWIGGQFEGDAGLTPPLVARLSREGGLSVVDVPEGLLKRLGNYVGSVAVNAPAGLVALSSPRGGHVLYLSAADGTPVGSHPIADVCGLAPLDDGFLVSDGAGGLAFGSGREPAAEPYARPAGVSWDNHMAAL
ncbi:DUF1513 domain-containing protein [Microvirga tunisiensis]|uniref:DUF1513 domain-containing protein n=1 Tax=Pannonibacter tanglangensis TaxID=2750084 RepID=A0A7X5JAE9_9HYPH|nr:DUF1513 domain-containing protein [Pannonibacter sp. XCT-53]NBN80462.1 DUF1513 domain-containing protein [Pannonibacter sp. XCT-53]